MPVARAAILHEPKAGVTPSSSATKDRAASEAQQDGAQFTRLHITPFNPVLLKSYLAPSVLPLAKNISYHTVETFPEKGFGYVELPAMEAQKLKKKLNGLTLKGSKVRIEDAKAEKRKAREDADAAKENEDRPVKRAKKDKKRKEQGVLEGAELPDDRKVKRGWTEPPTKNRKEKRDKKEKDKDKKQRKESKYTKEPEMLFKAKLTPVAATEVARKEKSRDKKKDKKEKKSKSKPEVVVHEFEKNTKQPSFLRESNAPAEKKPAVEYVNGKGWVDEDGNVVEAETGKARNRRVLELVDPTPVETAAEKKASATPSPKSSPAPKAKIPKKIKSKKFTPPSSPSASEDEDSSVVSSSDEDESSESESESESDSEASPSDASPIRGSNTPRIALTPSTSEKKEVHPLEALFKRSKPSTPTPNVTSTPTKLAPINTSFSFFGDAMDVDVDASENPPVTPYTQRDLEWRGLRSAAPTPDTAAIGRRFSFPWRNGSQEVEEDDEDDDVEAGKQLSNNTKANASKSNLPNLAEEDEDVDADIEQDQEVGDGEEEKPESEFRKWFWENQGNLNRAWKKRRRDALKAKRLNENKKMTGGRRPG